MTSSLNTLFEIDSCLMARCFVVLQCILARAFQLPARRALIVADRLFICNDSRNAGLFELTPDSGAVVALSLAAVFEWPRRVSTRGGETSAPTSDHSAASAGWSGRLYDVWSGRLSLHLVTTGTPWGACRSPLGQSFSPPDALIAAKANLAEDCL